MKKMVERTSIMMNKVKFNAKKHSPKIFMAVGVVGVLASTVMACKATLKAPTIIEEFKEERETLEKAKNAVEEGKIEESEYTENDYKKDLTIVYAKTGFKFIKNYALAVALGGLSIASIVMSHKILSKRNIALAAAYTTVDKGFKDYRNRVIERFGAEVDKELKYNIKAKEIEETVVNKKGKEETVKKTVNVVDINEYSDYARFFDEGNPNWDKNPEYNLTFLNAQQSYANDLLRARGYLFLNEVYKMIGMEPSVAGQVVGWTYDPDNNNTDSYVDFGIFNGSRAVNRDFVNGYEPVILLDFNVEGNILDKGVINKF
jgi:hypothetical protein